jgi:type IV pilus assembly protein PilA
MRRVRKGFTLIELLIVVVIIGILAAIAIPKFANTKEKAYLATMKGDLRNLATAQEGYASDNAGAYMPTTAGVTTTTPLAGYAPTTGVTIAVTNAGAGWSATAVHAQAPAKNCAIFVNTAAVAPATADGEPKCN